MNKYITALFGLITFSRISSDYTSNLYYSIIIYVYRDYIRCMETPIRPIRKRII